MTTAIDPSSDDDISSTTFKGKITIAFSQTGDAVVTGDSYGYVSVDGNKVTVNNTGGEVLVYELTGTTSNGFFKVYGAKKQAIVLNGASITNPDGAAINNQNKKRTFIAVFKAPSNIASFIVSAPSLTSGYKGVSVNDNGKCGGVWATDGVSGGSAVTLSDKLVTPPISAR